VTLKAHLVILPILLPLFVGAALLFFDERRRLFKSACSLGNAALLVVVAIVLIDHTKQIAPLSEVYRLGNWPAPFAIVLVADRLSGILLLLALVLRSFPKRQCKNGQPCLNGWLMR